jgi:AmmeMemoRadiSam system protein B
MASVRPTAVAGSFYPGDGRELSDLIEQCFVSHFLGPCGAKKYRPSLVGGMVPHAGLIYSGPCAAHLYACLDPRIERVVIIGVNHYGRGWRAALSPWDKWETPLGDVTVNCDLNAELVKRVGFLKENELAHVQEHSIEVQLPFLQRVLGDFTFLPISLADLSMAECEELGCALADTLAAEPEKGVVLASSDLSHYLSAAETEKIDRLALDPLLATNPTELLSIVAQENISMCGVLPAAVLLYFLNARGPTRPCLLKHYHSGDVAPMKKVVGYASVAFEQ